MATTRFRLILNPKAGAGAARRSLPNLLDAMHELGVSFELAQTSGPGDATRLARSTFDDGLDVMLVVGGDGTVNEVVQAYIDDDGKPLPGPRLGIIPVGTGGDFRKTVQIPTNPREAIERVVRGSARPVDLGILQLTDHQGQRRFRAFLNVTSFGIGGLTDRLVNETPKWAGGKASFFIGATRAALRYRNVPTVIRVDGREIYRGPLFNGVIANGRYFGGGMQVAPRAEVDDGLFDVIVLGDLSFSQALLLGKKIYRGEHLDMTKVSMVRGKMVEAEPLGEEDEVLLDVDGETPGRLPLKATIAPGAIQLVA